MSWSKQIIQNGQASSLPRFADSLPTVQESLRQIGAESQADRIHRDLERLKREASEAGHAEGFQRGFDEGVRLGREEGINQGRQEALAYEHVILEEKRAEIQQFASAMEDFVQRVEACMGDWQRAAEQKLTSLAIEIARQALRKELELGREGVLEIAKQAVGETINSRSFRIRVNPFDVSILESHKTEITNALSHIRSLEVVADDNIEAGCIVEAEEGIIDARVDSYLDRLETAMKEAA